MSSTAFLSLLMATFACIGFVLAIVMGRLGYSPLAWGLLGLLLGPIALLLALVEVRKERPWWTRLVASGDPGGGPVDVLVGIDGSPESAAATAAALELLGGRMGRLILVAVTDLDDSYAGREERMRLQGELERQAEAVRAWLRERDGPVQAKQAVVPELKLMAGRPATTLDTIAAEDGYDLLVAGPEAPGCPVSCSAAWRPGWPPGRACRCWWSATGPRRAATSASCARSTRPTRVPDRHRGPAPGRHCPRVRSGRCLNPTVPTEPNQLPASGRTGSSGSLLSRRTTLIIPFISI